ncbi:PREDICTED: proline-rich receptor-like protein kinase PERK2, partial [Galeopterus variegatus]|uniref:Proline-rich receptor-like protein kinase PERK2 n=1 Tax=Galeopterus variegatus TaxID=482537 RepID=A0ABM0PZN8_GALVR
LNTPSPLSTHLHSFPSPPSPHLLQLTSPPSLPSFSSHLPFLKYIPPPSPLTSINSPPLPPVTTYPSLISSHLPSLTSSSSPLTSIISPPLPPKPTSLHLFLPISSFSPHLLFPSPPGPHLPPIISFP